MSQVFELMPLIAMIIGYKLGGMIYATKWLIAASLIFLAINFAVYKKVKQMQMISVALVCLMGGVTVVSDDPIFIKMKPTFLYSLISLFLIGGMVVGKLFIKNILASFFDMQDANWRKLTIAWAIFFIMYAGLNELVWRNCSELAWMKFKIFAAVPLTLVFLIGQAIMLRRYIKTDSKK